MSFVTPVTCVVANVLGHVQDDKPAIRSVTSLKEELRARGYLVDKVKPVYKTSGYQGVVLIEFGDTDDEIISAVKLQAKFEAEEQGWINWDRDACLTGCFLWLANKDDARYFKHLGFLDYKFIPTSLVVDGEKQAREDSGDVVDAIQHYFNNLYA